MELGSLSAEATSKGQIFGLAKIDSMLVYGIKSSTKATYIVTPGELETIIFRLKIHQGE